MFRFTCNHLCDLELSPLKTYQMLIFLELILSEVNQLTLRSLFSLYMIVHRFEVEFFIAMGCKVRL